MNNDIFETAKLFFARNEVVEVRVIGKNKKNPDKKDIASGYFDNFDALKKEVSKLDRLPTVSGIYITLNQPKPEYIHNLNQPIIHSTKPLSDKHIDRIKQILIDHDPERETGTNSTDEELEASRQKMNQVRDALEKEGFRVLAICMSGNGYHILIAVDLPVEDKILVRDFLKVLDHRFSDDAVKVDTTVFNPARITKLYGTMTRKGPDTPERPQRRSKIESIPDEIHEVTRQQLEKIVAKWGASKKEKATKTASRKVIDVPAYCQKARLEIVGEKQDGDLTIYQLKKCVFNPKHGPNEAALIQDAKGTVRFQCFHNSCEGRTFQDVCRHLGVYPDEWAQYETATPTDQDGWRKITLFNTDADTKQPSYPFGCLPKALRTAVKEIAKFFKVSIISPAIVGTSVLATAIGMKARIEERPGLYHHPSLFFIGVACPSERKSPVFKAMTNPLNAWAKNEQEAYKADLSKARFKNSLVESAQAKLQSDAKKSGADLDKITTQMMELEAEKVPVPAPPRQYTTDYTEQRLFQLMYDHGGAFAVLSGEGRTVINSILGRYSDGTGEALYLAGISGDVITRDRVGNQQTGSEEKTIFDPCLNVCIFTQPDKVRELTTHPAMVDSGLRSRIWGSGLPPTAGTREEAIDEQGLNSSALDHYNQTVIKILGIKKRDEPHLARMTPEAAEARRQFHNEIERQLGRDGALADVADTAGKCCSQVAKLALIFHIADNPSILLEDHSFISLSTWNQAEQVGRFHLQETIRLQRSTNEDNETDTARKIARWLIHKNKTEFTLRELMQSGPRPRLNRNDALKILTCLEDHNVIKRDKSVYTVNPLLEKSVANVASVATPTLKNENQRINNIPATMATNGLIGSVEEQEGAFSGPIREEEFEEL